MGVPKRLTEMQQKFAHLLVTNEGRMTGYECAKEAGYSEDRARQTAYELQNPKLFPLVVKYIGEIREENNKKYQVDYGRHIAELGKIRQEALKKGDKKEADKQWNKAQSSYDKRRSQSGKLFDKTGNFHDRADND